jgi:hypothetical protein
MAKLPVEPERLRARFPGLTDDDLLAYVTITRRVLADPRSRGRALAEVMAAGQRAREREAAGAAVSEDEALALRYLLAVRKMQG